MHRPAGEGITTNRSIGALYVLHSQKPGDHLSRSFPDSGIVHPVHRVTRDDVTFFNDGDQLDFRRWRQADMVKVRLRGHKGDQLQEGSTIVRTRSEVVRVPR